ncbi:MAG: hypothetical protein AAB927_04345 [Patescibacteria group bacterium]
MSADKKPVSFESRGMQRVLAVLAQATSPVDDETIATRACVGLQTFTGTYRHLLLRAGKIHIADLQPNRVGPAKPLYAPGPLVGDPPVKPPRKPAVIAQRDWRERTAYYESIKARTRLARPPDPALAALLGLTTRYHKAA